MMTRAKGMFLPVAFGLVAVFCGVATAKEFEGIAQDLPLDVPYGAFPGEDRPLRRASGILGPAGPMGTPIGHMPMAPGGVAQASCDVGVCDGGCAGCATGNCGVGKVGLLNRLGGLGGCSNCGSCGGCGGLGLSNFCIFCRGAGCGVCLNTFHPSHLYGLVCLLAPYQEAGICAQRWYDISVEALFLEHDPNVGAGSVIGRFNGPGGPVALSTDDAGLGDLEAGLRLSGSMIFGAGGNLELTYMGLNRWEGQATAVGAGNLFSVITGFGVTPPGGYDETDRSNSQTLRYESEFHSGEFNYRRRWVGPHCRFQGSWLVGLRHLDLDETTALQIDGFNNNAPGLNNGVQTFLSNTDVRNMLTGFQAGGDLWWNVMSGVNLGVSLKGGILGNDAEASSTISANSVNPPVTLLAGDSRTSYITELQATLIYRFSYSWSARASYYWIGIDNVALGAGNVVLPAGGGNPLPVAVANIPPTIDTNNDLDLNGFSVGFEYIW